MRPTVPEVMPLVRRYYEKHPSGGSLHILLDDGNVSDSDADFCLKAATEAGDADGVELARLVAQMSRTQRLKLGANR